MQPPCGHLQRPAGDVGADDLGVAPVADQRREQRAAAAAQVEHPGRAGGFQRRQDRRPTPYGQRLPLRLGRVPDGLRRCHLPAGVRTRVGPGGRVGAGRRGGVCRAFRARIGPALRARIGHLGLGDAVGLGGVLGQPQLGEPGERQSGECPLVGQVAAAHQCPLGVVGEPARTRPQQFVDLVRRDPVVLRVVQHRQQDIEVVERVGELLRAGQQQVHVAAGAPLRVGVVQRDLGRRHRPAERGEEPLGDLRATAAPQHRHPDLQRDRRRRQLGPVLGVAAQRGAEHLGQRRGQQAGGGVRPVVDVLAEAEPLRHGAAPAPAAPTTQPRGVHLQQQRRRAARRVGLRVEDVRGAARQIEAVQPVRMLDQQVAQIGGRLMRGGDGEQHRHMLPRIIIASPRFPGRQGS